MHGGTHRRRYESARNRHGRSLKLQPNGRTKGPGTLITLKTGRWPHAAFFIELPLLRVHCVSALNIWFPLRLCVSALNICLLWKYLRGQSLRFPRAAGPRRNNDFSTQRRSGHRGTSIFQRRDAGSAEEGRLFNAETQGCGET
jgi:hypothetical protein